MKQYEQEKGLSKRMSFVGDGDWTSQKMGKNNIVYNGLDRLQ